tara:strand:+ start:26 stop:199 length:174 start_codon:yes stop_codon:yes gene_type:complete
METGYCESLTMEAQPERVKAASSDVKPKARVVRVIEESFFRALLILLFQFLRADHNQ